MASIEDRLKKAASIQKGTVIHALRGVTRPYCLTAGVGYEVKAVEPRFKESDKNKPVMVFFSLEDDSKTLRKVPYFEFS